MQKENYEKAKTKQFEKYRAISLYTLLATQIKYDVTGIAVGLHRLNGMIFQISKFQMQVFK